MPRGASRSYYADLISAGGKLFEYNPGLMHTKPVTVDREVTPIGFANMDCRSFALNFENSILLVDPATPAAMRDRQLSYLADSIRITATAVAKWSGRKRFWNNTFASVGPPL